MTVDGMAKTEHAVVIAGGGPTGLMLAGELALAGVDVAIVERRASQDLAGSRAGGLHARTIEVLDQRGIADRFLAEGQMAQVAGFAGVPLDISDFPTRHNYGLGLWQNHIERILAGWVDELAVPIHRGREVTGLRAGRHRRRRRSCPTAGRCGRSTSSAATAGAASIRKAAGIEFPGWDPTTSSLIAEVEMTEEPELGIRRDALGIHALGRVEYEIRDGRSSTDEGPVGVMVTEQHVGATAEPTLQRSQRGAHRRLRDRLRHPQPDLDLPVHRHDPAGRGLPRGTGAAGRRRRARALPGRRTGPQHRRAGRGEPGLEAGPGGQRDVAGEPARHLPRRAPPGRRPRAAQHDGAGRAAPRRTTASRRCATSWPSC